ncbi:hypothetical protein V8C37DRAFT_352793 [Trichoderma ceciliae]
MPEQTRRRTRTTRKKTKKPKEITFHKFLRSLPRPYPDPYIEWHIGLYDAATTLKRQLEGLTHKPLLSNDDLLQLGVVRGAEFIIDEDNPIDLDPRFFNPGSPHEVAQCVQNYEETKKWPRLRLGSEDRLDYWGYPLPYIDEIEEFSYACWTLVEWERRYSFREEGYTHRENQNWGEPFVSRTTNFYHFKEDWIHQDYRHQFLFDRWMAYRPFLRSCDPGPEVSHTLAMTADTVRPDDRLLRSELLMAAMFLRDNLAHRFWPGHYTFPVLMFSFYITGCRLLQIHLENGRLHVRASRPLDLISNDGSVPSDARLVARWLMAEPIGKTHFTEIPRTKSRTDDQHGPQNPGVPWALALSP